MTDKNVFIKIPYPKEIPVCNSFKLEGYPKSLTDYYILDFHAEHIKGDVVEIKSHVAALIPKIGKSKLSSPIYVGREHDYDFFACLNEEGELVVMQSKYYQYFKCRYPGCYFVGSDKLSPVGVMSDSEEGHEVLGILMPLHLTEEMYGKLCQDISS
jgi:hypothetical protein